MALCCSDVVLVRRCVVWLCCCGVLWLCRCVVVLPWLCVAVLLHADVRYVWLFDGVCLCV